MDKEKLKKYAGYGGCGLVGGLICLVVLFVIPEFLINGWNEITSLLLETLWEGKIFLLISILGGGLMGVITKKWWIALEYGFVIPVVIGCVGWVLAWR